jgi:hypothetical protein
MSLLGRCGPRTYRSGLEIPYLIEDLVGSISPEDCDLMEKAIEEAFEQIDQDAWK